MNAKSGSLLYISRYGCRYSWCAARLFKDAFIYSLRPPRHDELVPMESTCKGGPDDVQNIPRLVLGHNVGFDRAYIRDQYFIKVSNSQ